MSGVEWDWWSRVGWVEQSVMGVVEWEIDDEINNEDDDDDADVF